MWNSNSNYFKADTLEELVEKMYEGYSDEVKANALASIKRYNEFAVSSSMHFASSGSTISPLPITGIDTASFTALI